MYYKVLIFILIIILIFILLRILRSSIKKYNNSVSRGLTDNINYYVIHEINNNKRDENIQNNKAILGRNINIFDAIMIKQYNSEEIKKTYNIKNINEKLLPGEIGCFLSHIMLLRSIKNTDGYTVIFEDDLNIIDKDLHNSIKKILDNLNQDFDIIFLGNLNDNHGELVIDNIYKTDPNNYLWGTHAYVVNNKKIPNILQKLTNIDIAIDNLYEHLAKTTQLKIFVIYPIMVGQISTTIGSTIRNN